MKCVRPCPQYTGQCGSQPRAQDVRPSWALTDNGSSFDFHEAGFLDAPEHLPSGSVRACDIGSVRLMVAEVERDGIVGRAAS